MTAGKLPHPQVIPGGSRSAGSAAASSRGWAWRTGSSISMALFCTAGIDNGGDMETYMLDYREEQINGKNELGVFLFA